MVSLFGLDHDVINVGLNGPPNEVPEILDIQCRYVAPAFFKLNGIEM